MQESPPVQVQGMCRVNATGKGLEIYVGNSTYSSSMGVSRTLELETLGLEMYAGNSTCSGSTGVSCTCDLEKGWKCMQESPPVQVQEMCRVKCELEKGWKCMQETPPVQVQWECHVYVNW